MKVSRKGYKRRGYHRKGFLRDSIHVPPTEVKAAKVPKTTFFIKDIGAVGRAKEPYKGAAKLKKGKMTKEVARVLGYEKVPTELTVAEWERVFRGTRFAPKAWLGMLNTQIARRRFSTAEQDGRYPAKVAFQKAVGILARVRDLTPREAIRKRWA